MKLRVFGDAELIEDFCRDCMLRGMTEESVRRYKSSLSYLPISLQAEEEALELEALTCMS